METLLEAARYARDEGYKHKTTCEWHWFPSRKKCTCGDDKKDAQPHG